MNCSDSLCVFSADFIRGQDQKGDLWAIGLPINRDGEI